MNKLTGKKKLEINGKTLRVLNQRELGQVAGGFEATPADINRSNIGGAGCTGGGGGGGSGGGGSGVGSGTGNGGTGSGGGGSGK